MNHPPPRERETRWEPTQGQATGSVGVRMRARVQVPGFLVALVN